MKPIRPVLVLTAALFFLLPLSFLRAGDAEEQLSVTLLARDLGDPRAPSNLKMAIQFPESLAHRLATAKADEFTVQVFPDNADPDSAGDEYRAGGIYLWRNGQTLFLDVRQVPLQDKEGEASVVVSYHPDGGPAAATGWADATCTYATQLVDVFLAVDISSSMNYTDPRRRRVTAARTFIEMAREGGGIGRVGLITFNSRARLNTPLVPLSQGENLLNALRRVGANGLTSLDAPLTMGLEEFAKTPDATRPVIILLTDGRNEGSRYRDTHLQCAQANVRVYTIGLTELADHELLKSMAETTGGMYFRAPSDEDLPEIYARLAAELGKRRIVRTQTLTTPAGELAVPIDASLRRLVAISDSGARIRAIRPDGGSHAGGRFANVHLIAPEPGQWQFAWMDALPDVSELSLSGDSQFFLDLFPPQYRPGKIAVGATLAEGERPLGNAEVWVEPIPGVVDERFALFDDGRHGDGAAGDGVYGAFIDVPVESPERISVMVRASGSAWDYGEFVRQATLPADRMPDPPVEGTVRLDGDIDFGVLFPGEIGSAVVSMDLDAKVPRDMHFDLLWNNRDQGWPDLSSSLLLDPGKHAFEMEMTVPASAQPGIYEGLFAITDRGEIHDDAPAHIKVGTVRFDHDGVVDLGIVPPGTFASHQFPIAYSADKEADLLLAVVENAAVAARSTMETLPEGIGDIPVDLIVTVPMNTPDGVYEAVLRLAAGPGNAAIRIRWEVEQYDAPEPEQGAPLSGLPEMPSLPGPGAALRPNAVEELQLPDDLPPVPVERPSESPWEKADRALRSAPDPMPAVDPSALGRFDFPDDTPVRTERGDSFWSAWWMYLLGLLLLLLLLLLLAAYILYRLGKSAMARFLLVSGIANLILLAAFITLLSTASGARAESQRVAVTLVEDGYEPGTSFSDAELGMLGSASTSGTGAGAGTEMEIGEVAFDQPSGSASSLLVVRNVEIPESGGGEIELSSASQPSAMPLESTNDDALRRRERRTDRPERLLPQTTLPELAEPPSLPAEQAGTDEELGEMRLQLEASDDESRPAWSDGERVAQPLAATPSLAAPENSGAEVIALEPASEQPAQRGRRRAVRESSDAFPEPRVEISDPARDAETTNQPETAAQEMAEPGVREIRPQPIVSGDTLVADRPGSIILPEVAVLDAANDPAAGLTGVELAQARQRSGLRSSRGSVRTGGSEPLSTTVPGGAISPEGSERNNGGGGEGSVGEMRFDTILPRDGDTDGLGGSGRGLAGRGDRGLPGTPSPVSGNGTAPRLSYAGEENDGLPSLAATGDRGTARRNGNAIGSSQPQGLASVPAGSGGTQANDSRGDRRSGTSEGSDGIDEGRFADRGGLPDAGGGTAGGRRSSVGCGFGRSDLDMDGQGAGLRSIPLDSAGGDWRRNARRDRRRSINVASSSLDADSLLIVVGDFARLPDPASEKLFGVLANRLGSNLRVEDRRVSPEDATLADCLLALLTPEEVRDWTDAEMRSAAAYLQSGGHIWMDAARPDQNEPFMRRLAQAAGGEYARLPADHQLAQFDPVNAVLIGGNVAAVSTTQDWRKDWRYDRANNGPTMRFLIRGLNYFLSGNAETGIVLEPDELADSSVQVQPFTETMPETLAGIAQPDGRLWDNFSAGSVAAWRMPGWSDAGTVSSVSDGQGGTALKLDADGGGKGRTALYKTLSPPEDFSTIADMSMDVYSDGSSDAAVSMVFTVQNGGGWTDYETRPVRLRHGWNRVVFHLDRPELRSLANGSGYTSALPDAEELGRVGFFLYRSAEKPGVVLIRDMRVHEK